MLNLQNIFDTIDMIDKQHLDIRTITMGISLLDCVSEDAGRCCDKIYDKICRRAEKLVRTGEDIESEFGIPIVNKRISVTPMALVAGGCDTEDYVPFALTLDRAAQTCGVNFIGGYSALVQKGFDQGRRAAACAPFRRHWPRRSWCAPASTWAPPGRASTWTPWPAWAASSRRRPHLTADAGRPGLRQAGGVLQRRGGQPLHGRRVPRRGRGGQRHQRGRVRPRRGVPRPAVRARASPSTWWRRPSRKTAFQITRMGQMVAAGGRPAGWIRPSASWICRLAPTPAVGDSVARILEEMGLEVCGTHGTTAALALLNDAVKKGGVMASGHVGGLSGAFIPVSARMRA